MGNEDPEIGECLESEANGPKPKFPTSSVPTTMPPQYKPLTLLEKRFLLAVERGDLGSVRRFIQESPKEELNINCCDPIGRSGLLMAIDNENLEMIELLLNSGVEMKDALLHAINEEFVEAVELLLDNEDLIHIPGQPHSWEMLERETFTSDITPLILAAHRNNYEIIKIILDRQISPIPSPHDARCGCGECRIANKTDCLRHSRSRINAYRALSSPSLISLSSKDPILTAFELSWQLRRLSFLEPEFKSDYMELRKQCQAFATALLDHTRTTQELGILLNYDPMGDPFGNIFMITVCLLKDNGYKNKLNDQFYCHILTLDQHGRMQLARLKLAIKVRQKKFCAHANVHQLLGSIWYEGLPGFRRMNVAIQVLQIILIGTLFPVLSLAYTIAPYSSLGKFIRKPFIKFICHSASYITFLTLLILASQRIETDLFGLSSFGDATTKRGAPPTLIELLILPWIFGLIWSEVKQLWDLGISDYLNDMWNILDFITNALYVATIALRIVAFLQVQKEVKLGTGTASLPREDWDAYDPILLSEGLFAAANIFSSLKLVYIFSVNPYLGPLQISLGRMVIDIMKFFSIFTLVLFAFACGLNQLLWYYSEMEKKACDEREVKERTDACIKWRRFANLFESCQTLFWAAFGLIDLESFELTGIQSYTRFWGLLMFGIYCIINVVVLLNLLIAMMNHSYQIISDQSDTEWKFARSKLWMSYFEDGATVPPPFNIIPTPKTIYYLFRWLFHKFCSQTKYAKTEAIRTIRRKARKASERDHKYQSVMRLLIRRYITSEQRMAERQRGVTEDDCNEIKQDISSLKFELIEMLGGRKTGSGLTVGKKGRQRERRLMKGFNFDLLYMDSPVSLDEDENTQSPSKSKSALSSRGRLSRIARGMGPKRRANRWRHLFEVTRNKVLPFSKSQDSISSTATVSAMKDERQSQDPLFQRTIFTKRYDSVLSETKDTTRLANEDIAQTTQREQSNPIVRKHPRNEWI